MPSPVSTFLVGTGAARPCSRLRSRDPALRPKGLRPFCFKTQTFGIGFGACAKFHFACANSYVGQIHEFALYIASLKFPYNLKKILLCPSVPYVVQIKAPSSVLPHEGGRRDVG